MSPSNPLKGRKQRIDDLAASSGGGLAVADAGTIDEAPGISLIASAWSRLRRNPVFLLGLAITSVFVVLAVISPWIAPHDPGIGYLIDKGLWGPLRRRGTGLIAALVVSIGLSLVMRYLYLYSIGGSARSYGQYATQQPLTLGPISIPPRDLVIMGLSVIVLTAVGMALIKTRLGKATRAVADNPPLAATSGIDGSSRGQDCESVMCQCSRLNLL